MIDFRYHLVSLVSVFMALAIGVVLGAGPLRDSIGDQLSNQVDGLLRDKSDLQEAVANRDSQLADRDAFISAVGADLTGSGLAGRRVVVLTLAGADSGVVDALAEQVEGAGGTVTGRVAVNPRWSDPEQTAFRQSLAGQLARDLPATAATPGAPTGTDDALAALLASAVLTAPAGDSAVDPAVDRAEDSADDARAVLDALAGGELVGVDGEPQSGADLAVVVSGAPEDSVVADDPEGGGPATASHLALLRALDAGSGGVVLAGPLSATVEPGAVAALRGDDDLAARVSGVDSVDTAMGRVTTVLALVEELSGRSGQYGFGDDAAAPVPERAAADPGPGTDG